MNRIGIALVGMVGFFVGTPGAAVAQSVEWDGSVLTRFETRGVDGGDDATFTWLQTRLSAEGTVSPMVRFFAQAQDVRRYGEETSTLDGSADQFDFHQGFIEIGVFDESPLWLRLGRQEYEVAFGRLLGRPIWAPTSRAYDGLRAATPLGDAGRLELFGFQIAESTGGTNPSDAYLAGAWAEFGFGDARTLHLFAIHDRDDDGADTQRTTFGTEINGAVGPVGYRVEAIGQAGTVEGLDLTAGSLLAGFASLPVADGRGSLGVGYDRYGGNAAPGAGETAGFSDLFGRNHRFLGFADIFNDPRSNTNGRGLQDLNLRAVWGLRDGLDLRVDYHRFALVDDAGFDEASLADEIDVQVMGRLIDGLDIRAGGSYVGANPGLTTLGLSAGDQLFGYIQLSAGFDGGPTVLRGGGR